MIYYRKNILTLFLCIFAYNAVKAATNDGIDKSKKYMAKIQNDQGSNFKRAGSYSSLNSIFTQRIDLVELDHTPPNDSYKNTVYSSISYNNKPAIALLYEDHRSKFSTGSSDYSTLQRALLNSYMKDGNFANACLIDLIDTHNVSVEISGFDYRQAMREYLDFIRNNVISGAPNNNVLISDHEYKWLLNFVNNLNPGTSYSGTERIPSQ